VVKVGRDPGMPRRKGGAGDRQLRARGESATSSDELPLVHTTAVFTAGDILQAGKLQTTRCSVFGREMLYFFVLRPAYRSRRGAEKSHQLTRFPFVLILRPAAGSPPLHVYPFDTGAAVDGAFSDQADPLVPLEDYELEPTLAAASRHIEWAFGSRAAYYDGTLRNDVLADVPQHEAVTRGFVDVARMGRPGSNRHDRRASTVEVALSHDIELRDAVLLAIVPKQYLEDPTGPNARVMARMRELGIKHRTYDWQPNRAPDDFQDEIADIARHWYKQRRWL
jgi:hypothetical protein